MQRTVGITVGLVLLFLIVATSATASFPGANGRILFQTNRDGNAEIYSMDADGSNRVNLSRNGAEDTTPHWSADGRKIAFVSNRDGNSEILIMDGDGSGVAAVTATAGENNRWPSWTGDGRVLFQRGDFPNRHIYIVNADGTGLTNLTPDTADSAWAAAAPRGQAIAFSRYTNAAGQRLYTLNPANHTTKLVVAGEPRYSDLQPNWAPSGNDLVFVRWDETNAHTDLWVTHKDGTGLRQLTNTPDRQEYEPGFSPDGRKIVFHACNDPGGPSQHCANYVRNSDGSNEVDITSTPVAPYLDTFAGDQIDPFWQLNITGDGPTIQQKNGQLQVTFPVGTTHGPNGYADAAPFMACRLQGDFDMQVDYQLSGKLPDFMNVGFFASEFTNGNYTGANGMFVFNGFGSPGISTYFPTFPNDPSIFAPDTSFSGSLRLQRSTEAGITTLTASRLSAGNWVQMLTSSPYTYPVDASAANFNVFWNGAQPLNTEIQAGYDNFRINSGTITCPNWWDDSAPDWQTTK